MSRHAINLARGRTLVVGWDPPLQTFFAVLRQCNIDESLLYLGANLHELYDLEDLERALHRAQLAKHLTPELALRLERDREENPCLTSAPSACARAASSIRASRAGDPRASRSGIGRSHAPADDDATDSPRCLKCELPVEGTHG